jgi:hypothetical protein
LGQHPGCCRELCGGRWTHGDILPKGCGTLSPSATLPRPIVTASWIQN